MAIVCSTRTGSRKSKLAITKKQSSKILRIRRISAGNEGGLVIVPFGFVMSSHSLEKQIYGIFRRE